MSSRAKKAAKKVFKQFAATEQITGDSGADVVVHEGTAFKDAISADTTQNKMIEEKPVEVVKEQLREPERKQASQPVKLETAESEQPNKIEDVVIPKTQVVPQPIKEEPVEEYIITVEKQKVSKPAKNKTKKKPNMFEIENIDTFEISQEKPKEEVKITQEVEKPKEEPKEETEPQLKEDQKQEPEQILVQHQIVEPPPSIPQIPPIQKVPQLIMIQQPVEQVVQTVILSVEKPQKKKATEKKAGKNEKKKMFQQIQTNYSLDIDLIDVREGVQPHPTQETIAKQEELQPQQPEAEVKESFKQTQKTTAVEQTNTNLEFKDITQTTNSIAQSSIQKEQTQKQPQTQQATKQPVDDTIIEHVVQIDIPLQTLKNKKKQDNKSKKKSKPTVMVDTLNLEEIEAKLEIKQQKPIKQIEEIPKKLSETQQQVAKEEPKTEKIHQIPVKNETHVESLQSLRTQPAVISEPIERVADVPQTPKEIQKIFDEPVPETIDLQIMSKNKKPVKKTTKSSADPKKKKLLTDIEVKETIDQEIAKEKEPQVRAQVQKPNEIKENKYIQSTNQQQQIVRNIIEQPKTVRPLTTVQKELPPIQSVQPVAKAIHEIAQKVNFQPCYNERQNQIRQTVQMMSQDILSRKLNRRPVVPGGPINSPIIDQYIDQNVRLKRQYAAKSGGRLPAHLN